MRRQSRARTIGRELAYAALLVVAVSALTFTLFDYAGTDSRYTLGGRTLNVEQLDAMADPRSFGSRYLAFVTDLITFDLGRSALDGAPVTWHLAQAMPITIAFIAPGYLLGHVVGLLVAAIAALRRSARPWLDGLANLSLSLSIVVVAILVQFGLGAPDGLNLLPLLGYSFDSVGGYLQHALAPTLAMVMVGFGYHYRFYQSLVERELARDYVATASHFGRSQTQVLLGDVLPNIRGAALVRLIYALPLVFVGGSLVIETQFGLPGLGELMYRSLAGGDVAVIQAIVTWSAIGYALARWLALWSRQP